MNNRLAHDVAWVAPLHILKPLNLSEAEKQEAFQHVYECVKAALEAYEIQANREVKRLHPSTN